MVREEKILIPSIFLLIKLINSILLEWSSEYRYFTASFYENLLCYQIHRHCEKS